MITINANNDGKKIKKLNFFSDEKRYSICNFVKWFMKKFNDEFCFTKEDLEEINRRVEETKTKAKQYEKVEERLPDFFAIAQRLDFENDKLKNDNFLIFQKIEELFKADLISDVKRKKEIYSELGFDVSDINFIADVK